VLLLTWNNALYRYGLFDFSALETTLRNNMDTLNAFRERDILSFADRDKETIMVLFNAFLDALKIVDGKKKGTRSPVAVAKALHLLAPAFFPLAPKKHHPLVLFDRGTTRRAASISRLTECALFSATSHRRQRIPGESEHAVAVGLQALATGRAYQF